MREPILLAVEANTAAVRTLTEYLQSKLVTKDDLKTVVTGIIGAIDGLTQEIHGTNLAGVSGATENLQKSTAALKGAVDSQTKH